MPLRESEKRETEGDYGSILKLGDTGQAMDGQIASYDETNVIDISPDDATNAMNIVTDVVTGVVTGVATFP